jgi:hypothetical protein
MRKQEAADSVLTATILNHGFNLIGCNDEFPVELLGRNIKHGCSFLSHGNAIFASSIM